MSERTRLCLQILAVALVLGVTGDALLRAEPWGLNAALWTAALAAGLLGLLRDRRDPQPSPGCRWLLVPVVLFGAALAGRDSTALKLLNVWAVLVSLALLTLHPRLERLHLATLTEQMKAGMLAGIHAGLGMLFLLLGDLKWPEVSRERWSRPALAVARGLALALPPLAVFAALFMAADAVFSALVKRAIHINLGELAVHVLVFAFVAWVAGGYLRAVFFAQENRLLFPVSARPLTLGEVEVGIVLGLMNLLFLAFVLVQVRYFFGGSAWVQATAGLTYSEYARRGFFELVTVAALVLPLLLLGHWLLDPGGAAAQRLFRWLASVQIALLLVIMASAFQRMRLYQREFGLTEQRLYPTAFMAWLAVVFAWFVWTVLRGRRERFAFGALGAGYALVLGLNLLNPDALIVRTNLARAGAGRSFDAAYAASLSADALPPLLEGLPALKTQDRCLVAARLSKRWPAAEFSDWRAWSYSRAAARDALQANDSRLRPAGCPSGPEGSGVEHPPSPHATSPNPD